MERGGGGEGRYWNEGEDKGEGLKGGKGGEVMLESGGDAPVAPVPVPPYLPPPFTFNQVPRQRSSRGAATLGAMNTHCHQGGGVGGAAP